MKYPEMTWGRMEAVVNKLGGMEGVRRLLSGELVVKTVENLFNLIVDYALSVEEMVASGHYDWANSDITSDHFLFGWKDKTEVQAELLSSKELVGEVRSMSSDEVYASLDKLGYRPADLRELLAFGAVYPEEQRQHSIAALGSLWQRPDGDRSVAYLRGSAGRRGLYLYWLGNDWDERWRFLAVRK